MATPTLEDIAKAVGVSASTVSRALSGKGQISSALVEQIIAAAEALGYPLDRYQTSHNQSRLIGVIFPNVSSPFYSLLIEAVEKTASQHGFTVLLCNSDYSLDEELKCLKILIEKQVDGILISPVDMYSSAPATVLNPSIPAVQVDRHNVHLKCDLVTTDSFHGAYEGVKLLIEQGYRRIAIISGPKTHSTGKERLTGYIAALREAGISLSDEYMQIADFRQEDGYRSTLKLLNLNPSPEALFVTNVDMTIGALRALHEKGIHIPDDIGIIGFDEFEFASILVPPLTTIAQPIEMLGLTAVDLLVRRITNTVPSEPVTIKLAPRLTTRQSTRAHTSEETQGELVK